LKRQHRDGGFIGKRQRLSRSCLRWLGSDTHSLHRPERGGRFLDALLTQINKLDRDLVSNVIVCARRDADTPGSAMPSSLAAMLTPSPRMSSPSIRMSPRLIPIPRDTLVPLGHHRLHSYRTFDRIDHRGKLKQQTVSCGRYDRHALPPVRR
jgi:hypothetical protein